ncbi:RUS family member 1 isoform X2 [Diorhabda sublineata]|uniref:RUS family member 1 isoform X1 n=1 Tax=Diorhabda sublineata TaxID=1163346 RepID=UPI0024E1152D|nr:RUS family member 1 isoform X1 [Diorhabda sublineata]XP_056638915.1 RUS family member 1 isoform X2 [Diorhabda sublineata]
MENIEILLSEQNISAGDAQLYIKKSGNNEIGHVQQCGSIPLTFQSVINFIREVFLPFGYPETVSEDYWNYQLWDTAQAFCSTIIGAFTTRSILKGVGVGNSEANALSAAVTWILKDGMGMIGRIFFAWWKGNQLDSDCKKWRFFADILNDVAMTIELILPYFSTYSMEILCLTSSMKCIVGVAGGATRASITHHQAIKDNMAEISAKDGTQETLVNLIGSIVSLYLLTIFNDTHSEWLLIVALISLHLLTNYWAVKSLVFRTFNDQRLILVLKSYFNIGTVLSPTKINENENVILGRGINMQQICGFQVVIGKSLKTILNKWTAADLKEILTVYQEYNYLLLINLNSREIYIILNKGESAETLIAAYFNAASLAIATCIYNHMNLDLLDKRQRNHRTPVNRLQTFMKSYQTTSNLMNIPYNNLLQFQEFVKQEYQMFYTALQINGWNLNSHSLNMGQYRCDWKSFKKNE